MVLYLALQMVWVGFSAPAPRLPATFTYEGALAALDSGASKETWPVPQGLTKPVADGLGQAYVNHWVEIRGPSK